MGTPFWSQISSRRAHAPPGIPQIAEIQAFQSSMIHHATREIPPATLDECVDFYAIVGFRTVDAPPGIAGRAVWLEASSGDPHTQIHLMPTAGAQPNAGHIGIVCRDYETVLGALRSAGHEVEPRRRHWGSPRSYVRDPAGNLVELMATPPAQPGTESPEPG